MRWSVLSLFAAMMLLGCSEPAKDYQAADMTFFGDTGQLADGAKPAARKTAAVVGSPEEQAMALRVLLESIKRQERKAVLAVARVQGPSFDVQGTTAWGRGNYRVITGRGAERPQDIEKLTKLVGVGQVTWITELNLPVTLVNDTELRLAARELGADMLFVYTLGSTVVKPDHRDQSSPGSRAESTGRGVLLDARTGQVLAMVSKESRLAAAPFLPVTPDVDVGLIEQTQRLAFAGMADRLEKAFEGAK